MAKRGASQRQASGAGIVVVVAHGSRRRRSLWQHKWGACRRCGLTRTCGPSIPLHTTSRLSTIALQMCRVARPLWASPTTGCHFCNGGQSVFVGMGSRDVWARWARRWWTSAGGGARVRRTTGETVLPCVIHSSCCCFGEDWRLPSSHGNAAVYCVWEGVPFEIGCRRFQHVSRS